MEAKMQMMNEFVVSWTLIVKVTTKATEKKFNS